MTPKSYFSPLHPQPAGVPSGGTGVLFFDTQVPQEATRVRFLGTQAPLEATAVCTSKTWVTKMGSELHLESISIPAVRT